MALRFLFGLYLTLALPASSLPAQEKAAEEFSDRWVEYTSKGDGSGLQRLFTGTAKLSFDAQGHKREADPQRYAEFLTTAVKGLKSFSRERGMVELDRREGKPNLLTFVVTDQVETREGFGIRTETREEFEMEDDRAGRAVAYRSKVLSCHTLTRPESWMTYGGPWGLNGFLIQAEFSSAPPGTWLGIAGVAVSIIVVAMILHRLGLRRRL